MKKLIGFVTITLAVIVGLLPHTAVSEYLAEWIDDTLLALGIAGTGAGIIVVMTIYSFIKVKLAPLIGEYLANKFTGSSEEANKLMTALLDSENAKKFIATKSDLLAEKRDRLKAEALNLKYEIINLKQKLASGILVGQDIKDTEVLIAELQARYNEINA